MSSYPYTVTIETERDFETLLWLSAHGYDAGLYGHADELLEEDEATGRRVYGLSEPSAWEFASDVEADPDAFLACCGSPTLSAALLLLLGSIV